MKKLPIAVKMKEVPIKELQVGDRVIYIFDGPDRTGSIVYLDDCLASILDDEIKLRVSVNLKKVKQIIAKKKEDT